MAHAEFRRRRWQQLRKAWRDCAMLLAVAVLALLTVIFASGPVQLLGAAVLGFCVAIAMVLWLVGDVRALPFVWGAVGEQQTAAVLERLDKSWLSVHALPQRFGDWDHVVVGPPGLFLLDSKHLDGTVHVSDDSLRSGRLRHEGAAMRGAARELKETIRNLGVWAPFVQAVVVVWGDFPQRYHEEENVIYVAGTALFDWLRSSPRQLGSDRLAALREALRQLEAGAGSAPAFGPALPALRG